MPNIDDVRTTPGTDVKYFVNGNVNTSNVAPVNQVVTVQGPPGPQGVSVGNATIQGGDLIIYFTDNSYVNAGTLPLGPAGPQGPQGNVGSQGPQGTIGQQGIQGLTGPTGPAGPQGPVGPTGSQGFQGSTGATGLAGVGIVNSVVSNTGTLFFTYSNSLVVNAGVIPPGPTGATGPIGLTGPAGSIGPAGPTGPQGATGPSGAQGPIGNTGVTGATGATGATGNAGANGVTYEAVVTVSSASGTVTLDLGSNNFFNVTLTGNTLFALSNTSLTTRTYSGVIAVKQGSGSFTVTWPATCITPANVTYTQSTLNGAIDLYTVVTYNGGTSFLLSQIGQNYS